MGLCIAALGFRVTLGVDLGDEAYYAAFIDAWLKNGLGHSPFLMVHQTADLLVYPLAAAYRAVRGDAEGLVLFLRFVYVGIAGTSSACLYCAVAPHRGKLAAALSAVLALFFIPFTLPAPSYNTIGMYALLAALSLFSLGFDRLSIEGRRTISTRPSRALWASAACWAIACVAYPPLLVALASLVGLALLALRTEHARILTLQYTALCGALLLVALIMLLVALGPVHMLQMVRFTNAFNNVSAGAQGKLHAAFSAFSAHPGFALMCAMAILAGGMRSLHSSKACLLSDLMMGLLIVGVASSEAPTFFSRTHDLVLLLALSGFAVAFRQLFVDTSDFRTGVLAAIYGSSCVAGFTTAATAFNGLFNFPIGGFPAACLALLLPAPSTPPARAIRTAVMVLACGAMAMTSFSNKYYGQVHPLPYKDSVAVSRGAFAGLRTDADQAHFIAVMTEAIERQGVCGAKFAVLGTGPAFYLLTTMSPAALSTWNYAGDARNFATDAIAAFYSVPGNRPDVLVVNNWRWATSLSNADRKLLSGYTLVTRVVVGLHDASIYRRADCKR